MKAIKGGFSAIEKAVASDSLAQFAEMAWPIIDPGVPYIHGWHMEAMADHLEAVARKEIKRLLINIPPGTSKSTMTSVYFPAWLWGPFGMPHAKFIGASHEQDLAIRDNRKNRILIESEWYQNYWPMPLTTDQNEKKFFENEFRGWRQATAVKSMTGRRGDVVVWDDPLSPEKAYSDTERETANRVFAETLPTRLVDPINSAIIIVMQRLHEDDVSGYILSRDLGFEHLCLPMEFEAARRCKTKIFTDPRTKEGELLAPDRFPREVVDRDKKTMGSFATAGQFQQRPVPREGGLFKRSWFEFVAAVPANRKVVRAWDLASTEDDPMAAATAGVKMSVDTRGVYYVEHAVREQLSGGGVRNLIKQTAELDGKMVKGSIPQDPGQAGKTQAQDFIRMLAGFNYRTSPETGDKFTRAMPVAAQAEAGNVKILKTGNPETDAWIEPFLSEVTNFPGGKHKDQVDALSRAFGELVAGPPRAIVGRYGARVNG
jgi:predicted phage terminase large subunit-like protein